MRVALYRASGRVSIIEGDEAFIDLNVEHLPAGDDHRALDDTLFAAAEPASLPPTPAAFDAVTAA